MHWCKSELTISNPEYIKKARMGFWTGNTPEKLNVYEIHGYTLVLPYGSLRELLKLCTNADTVTVDFPECEEVDFKCDIPLYDYQEMAVDALVKAKYGILQAPTASGKTQIGIALAARTRRKTLWLTHTKDLLNQSKRRAEKYMNADLTGTITEGKVDIGEAITFATIQTMCRLDLSQYQDIWDVVIVDECHRVSGTPTAVTQFSKVLNSLRAKHKYGLSATVHRSDGMIRATYALLGGVVYTVPKEFVADRIMQVGIRPISTGITMSRNCLNSDGTLNYTKLINYLCDNETRNKLISEKIAADHKHPSLILSDRLAHLQAIKDLLPEDLQDKAVMVSGKMTTKKGKQEREQAIEQMRSGEKKYLFATYSLAKEGLDIPCLERLYITTPQKDYAVVTQSIGRIARTCEGKKSPICVDFVDDMAYLVKCYKKRCTIYRKNDCYFTGG